MTKWIVQPTPRPRAEVRLVCFPYAGAAAGIFKGWPALLPHWIDMVAVELPGRASHFSRPALVEIDAVVEALTIELAAFRDLPCIFYGHSLGAKIAFELACALQRRGLPGPAHVIAAARAAPDMPSRHDMNPTDLDRDGFVALLGRLAATPTEILENRELMDLLLPTIRADFQLNLSRSVNPQTRLACPITALCGTSDAAVPLAAMEEWRALTDETFDLIEIAGGHFFLNDAPGEVIEIVARIAKAARHGLK